MIISDRIPRLRRPVMVTAFEGWNNAGDAATDTVDHLRGQLAAQPLAEIEPDEYYDFQVNRPHIHIDGDARRITWPTTRFFVAECCADRAASKDLAVAVGAGAATAKRDLILVAGIEPNMKWRAFCAELLELADRLDVETVINIGSLLADVPHTRPVPTTAFATDPVMIDTLDIQRTTYEGPTGIVGVLQQACDVAGFKAISLWAAVPHYVANSPCPKATLALLRRLEDIIDVTIDPGQLEADSLAWQVGVDEMAAENSELADYVARLERARDSEAIEETSGEVIAAEFERYLRRRGR